MSTLKLLLTCFWTVWYMTSVDSRPVPKHPKLALCPQQEQQKNKYSINSQCDLDLVQLTFIISFCYEILTLNMLYVHVCKNRATDHISVTNSNKIRFSESCDLEIAHLTFKMTSNCLNTIINEFLMLKICKNELLIIS